MQIKGLAPHTAAIFDSISRLDCIVPYILVGGTALSLQIGSRQSEDLDFMSWRKSKNLLSILTRGDVFNKDVSFQQLAPIYDVSPKDIEVYIRSLLKP